MFLKTQEFPFTSMLEDHWQSVRDELEHLHTQNFVAWPEKFLYGQGWDVFGLYAFGNKLVDNCKLCPKTTALVEQVPGLTTAGFSSLQPGTHIEAHTGYTNAVLRCHLGLIVPDGCTMRVGDETRAWSEGRALVFDDTVEHEVWHRGDRPRIILLLDFKRDDRAHVAVPANVRDAVANTMRLGAA
jgi:aspartyl/asparaginyl beta-hydroxylase (cupin superfamily)